MTGRNIDTLSIFGEYTQKENRLTAALLHILNVGDEPLIRRIVEKLNKELPSNKIIITTQQKEESSIPDGTLECLFKFKIFIESKIKPNSIDATQLENHMKLIENYDENILLYITPDVERPEILDKEVTWANWTDILNWLEEYITKNKLDEGHQLFHLLIIKKE